MRVCDYSLTGPERTSAFEQGLVEAEWFSPNIDPVRLQELMTRTNLRAARDTVLWLALVIGLAVLGVITWGSWLAIPVFIAYGALYGGASDSRWHECGHGTAFRSSWANTAIYYLASFMLWREPTMWRWSHYRHHTDTIIIGRDAEIVFRRSLRVRGLILTYAHVSGASKMLWTMARHAAGVIDDEVRDFVPESELRRLVWEDRAYMAVLGAAITASIALRSPLPVLLVGLPTIYGGWLVVFFGITQHAGLRENVLDHRLNSRTVYMNPVFRFLYSNMNYHIEHHIYPAVPYHALPALHEEIKDQLPPALPSTLAAYREIFGALRTQERDPAWEVPDRCVPEITRFNTRRPEAGPIVPETLVADGWVELGSTADFVAGDVRRVDFGDRTFALICLGTDDFALVDGRCTHGRAHLADGAVFDCTIECPKHNGRFDLRTGKPTQRPASVALPIHVVRLDGVRILGDVARSTTASKAAKSD